MIVDSPFYPSSKKEFKIHYSRKVAVETLRLYNFLVKKKLFTKEFLRKYCNLKCDFETDTIRIENSEYNIPYSLQYDFYRNVIKKINPKWYPCQIRLEEIQPSSFIHNKHKRVARFNELKVEEKASLEDNQFNHPSILWHFDSKNELGTMVTIVYLSDVLEGGGGTSIAYPIIRPVEKLDNVDGVGISNSSINIKDIKEHIITGPSGTAVTFNSYSLHRGGVPLNKPRKALIINFCPPKYNKI